MKRAQQAGIVLGLVAAALTAATLFAPLIGVPERELAGRDVLDVQPVIAQLEARAARLDAAAAPEPRRFPPGRVGQRLRAKAEAARAVAVKKRDETRDTLQLVADCLRYARWALIGLLSLSVVQLSALAGGALPRIVAAADGVAGVAYVAALVLLSRYFGGVELFGEPLPLRVGWWLLLAASALFAIAGLTAATRENARWMLPLQWLPGVLFGVWFAGLLS